MLCEASESERPELRRKLDDLLFNEDCPYDSVSDAYLDIYFSCSPTIFEISLADKTGITRMEIPVPQGIFWSRNFQWNWKPAERHGYVFPCLFFYLDGSLSLETWQGGILYCCNLPSLSFSLLPLNLGSEVFRRTLLGVSVLFCGCTIMELVRITCSHILKINLLKDSIYLILRFMVQLVAGTTHSMLLLSYLISRVFLGFRYLSMWTNHCDHLISSWQFCLHKGTFTILTAAIYSDIAT